MFSLAGRRILVTGHRGMVGKALLRRLADEPCEIVFAERAELDLTRQAQVEDFLAYAKTHAIIFAAARVGGIVANDTRPADFLSENLAMAANLFAAAHATGIDRVLYLGSSCVYPRLAPQPIAEDWLLNGALEPTNQWYAIAKIAGIKLAQAYRRQHGRDYVSAMPTNLYGPGDNFDSLSAHVLPALLGRAEAAKRGGDRKLSVWGSGTPLREFLYVDDCADALVHILKHYSDETPINIGSGEEVSIADLARTICAVTGFNGALEFDATKPDGTPRKRLDCSRLEALGWRATTPLRLGIEQTYRWYQAHRVQGAAA